MSDIQINKPHAEIKEIKGYGQNTNMLRVWCSMFPNYYEFQIRTRNPLAGNFTVRKGKDRDLIATVGVSIEELEELLAEMKAYRDGKPSKFDS